MKDTNFDFREIDDEKYLIRSHEELDELYGEPHERSVLKVKNCLDENARKFIESSPFVVLATSDAEVPDGDGQPE